MLAAVSFLAGMSFEVVLWATEREVCKQAEAACCRTGMQGSQEEVVPYRQQNDVWLAAMHAIAMQVSNASRRPDRAVRTCICSYKCDHTHT